MNKKNSIHIVILFALLLLGGCDPRVHIENDTQSKSVGIEDEGLRSLVSKFERSIETDDYPLFRSLYYPVPEGHKENYDDVIFQYYSGYRTLKALLCEIEKEKGRTEFLQFIRFIRKEGKAGLEFPLESEWAKTMKCKKFVGETWEVSRAESALFPEDRPEFEGDNTSLLVQKHKSGKWYISSCYESQPWCHSSARQSTFYHNIFISELNSCWNASWRNSPSGICYDEVREICRRHIKRYGVPE
ncbi:MAG: hypothetical protein HN370_05445 [Phycisphaerales bacterium]|jgi:hypothetical protein|nr:hypothetical protein [Phycisphaerales bacterium]